MAEQILVTGAEGFIGSHLTEKLVVSGHKVRAFVLYNSFNSRGWLETLDPHIAESIEFFTGDIRDPNGVRNAIAGCDTVLHLAALIAIPYSYHSPDTYIDTNVKGTLNVLQAARDANVSRVIHTSTSEVYGTAQFVPINETHPLHAQSPYAASKIAADQLAMSFYYSFGLPVSVVRPFNAYGPRQSARAFIPAVITQMARGSELKLGSLQPTRDFSFVSDTVRAFEAVMQTESAIGQIFNAGSGFEISMADTVSMLAAIMGKDVNVVCDPQRVRPPKSEVERLWADASLLKETTGWQPEFGGCQGFRRGLEKTVKWFLNQDNLAFYKGKYYVM